VRRVAGLHGNQPGHSAGHWWWLTFVDDLDWESMVTKPHSTEPITKPMPVAAAIVVAVTIALVLAGCGRSSSSSGGTSSTKSAPKKTPQNCSSQGCASIEHSVPSPHLTVFYGGSCTGLTGAWFLNVTQGGSSTNPVASYHLKWTFPAHTTHAMPSGTIGVTPAAQGHPITMTIENGVVTITGTAADGTAINAQGTLAVDLAGSSSAPTLTVTEQGLASAESALGLTSPFSTNGSPTVLPVSTTTKFSGC
jgi:hypothetical protein